MNMSPNLSSILRKSISLTLLLSFVFMNIAGAAAIAADTKQMSPNITALAKYTTDLTQLGRNGSLRENLNLEREALRVLEVLGKGGLRQPVVIDEKSENQDAVAEQVAIRLANGNAPKSLTGKRLLKLEIASLYANSTSDADVEAIVSEVAKAAASSAVPSPTSRPRCTSPVPRSTPTTWSPATTASSSPPASPTAS